MSPLFVVVMVKPEKEGDKMSKREEYEARTEALLLPIMEEMHFELVDVEYVKEAVPGTCVLILIKKAVLPLMIVKQLPAE